MKTITLTKEDIETYIPLANEIMEKLFTTDNISESRRFYTFNEMVIPTLIVDKYSKEITEDTVFNLPAVNLSIQVKYSKGDINFSVHHI